MTKKKLRNQMITVRLTKEEKRRLEVLAEMYGNGDLSQWVRHCLENYQPKLVKTRRKKRRAPKRVTG